MISRPCERLARGSAQPVLDPLGSVTCRRLFGCDQGFGNWQAAETTGFFCASRQTHRKRRSFIEDRTYGDAASVSAHDLIYDEEAKADVVNASGGIAARERL